MYIRTYLVYALGMIIGLSASQADRPHFGFGSSSGITTKRLTCMYFSFTSHLLCSPFVFLSFLVVTQIRSHIKGSSPPLMGPVYHHYVTLSLSVRHAIDLSLKKWVDTNPNLEFNAYVRCIRNMPYLDHYPIQTTTTLALFHQSSPLGRSNSP